MYTYLLALIVFDEVGPGRIEIDLEELKLDVVVTGDDQVGKLVGILSDPGPSSAVAKWKTGSHAIYERKLEAIEDVLLQVRRGRD